MWITKEMIENSVNTIFIFGDNLQQRGLGGQAKICRPFVKCGKAFGIPTKRYPSMNNNAFFSDTIDEVSAVIEAFCLIDEFIKKGYKIIFLDNIGCGMAKLPIKSPKIYKMIKSFINSTKLTYFMTTKLT